MEIDPRRLTREHVEALREVGFNRASFGVQDFDPIVQEAVHRIQPRDMTEQALAWARELGFSSINFDLIYGLPHQTVESFNRTLEIVLSLKPDRLAVFSYAHVPWVKPAQKILEQKILPTPEVKLQLLKTVIERLTEKNQYMYIGMDHFARPGDELAVAQRQKALQRNFQGTARAVARTSTPSACRPFPKYPMPIGKMRKSCRNTMPNLTRAKRHWPGVI